MNKKITISVLIFLSFFSFALAETIVFKSGKTIEEKIIERTNKIIKVDISGIPITYYLEDIESIDEEVIGQSSAPTRSFTAKTTEIPASQILEDVSPAAVVILMPQTGNRDTFVNNHSGVIVDGNGIVLTCFHAIGRTQDIKVKTQDGRIFPVAGVIAVDMTRDIYLLKINARNLPFVTLGDSETLEPGEKIFAVGVTSSLPYTISNGLFNSKRKLFSRNLLQFTAPIPSGGIGAPLLDIYGNVIGIVALSSRSGSDLNFAVPMDKGIKDFIEDSIKKVQERGLTEIFEHFQHTEEYYKAAVGYDQKWKQKQHDTADCFRNGNCGGDNCTQAIEYYEKTFRTGVLAPDDIQRLGLLYCWCRNDFDKGISYMKTAIEFDPGIGSTVDYYTEAMETKIDTLLLEYEYGEAKKWKARYQQDLEELSLFIPEAIAKIRANSKVLNMDWQKLPKKSSGK